MNTIPKLLSGLILLTLSAVSQLQSEGAPSKDSFMAAAENGKLYNEGLRRCQDYVNGWLAIADPKTGLIPRNRKDRYWNAKDAAADNYPFMVLTTSFTDRSMFEGRMQDMLETEIKLTSRIGALPDTYDFEKATFLKGKTDLHKILFGSSEYIKDGLLPITEWLGESPWSDRMISILDDMWLNAPLETPYGNIPSRNVELNGEMLQVLSRLYWMKGEKKYLDWAVRLGDYYLLDKKHPTRNMKSLKLRDHGCEVISGLCELYATVHYTRPEKKQAYQKHVHEMLDRILEVGRNEHGMFYNEINPVAGTVPDRGMADTWGYTFNGFYTVYLIDGTQRYLDAIMKALHHLNDNYRSYNWENWSADGYADSIESALNLYNRKPLSSVAEWIDSEIKNLWRKQKKDGIIEGWHGDGNFARTTIMYCLWKTQGVSLHPWRSDLELGAVRKDDKLYLSLKANEDWNGKVVFDSSRHKTSMNLPVDWPRINQFPEWFTVDAKSKYELEETQRNTAKQHDGDELKDGVELSLKGNVRSMLLLSKI